MWTLIFISSTGQQHQESPQLANDFHLVLFVPFSSCNNLSQFATAFISPCATDATQLCGFVPDELTPDLWIGHFQRWCQTFVVQQRPFHFSCATLKRALPLFRDWFMCRLSVQVFEDSDELRRVNSGPWHMSSISLVGCQELGFSSPGFLSNLKPNLELHTAFILTDSVETCSVISWSECEVPIVGLHYGIDGCLISFNN